MQAVDGSANIRKGRKLKAVNCLSCTANYCMGTLNRLNCLLRENKTRTNSLLALYWFIYRLEHFFLFPQHDTLHRSGKCRVQMLYLGLNWLCQVSGVDNISLPVSHSP